MSTKRIYEPLLVFLSLQKTHCELSLLVRYLFLDEAEVIDLSFLDLTNDSSSRYVSDTCIFLLFAYHPDCPSDSTF